jgi:hypothetical protein
MSEFFDKLYKATHITDLRRLLTCVGQSLKIEEVGPGLQKKFRKAGGTLAGFKFDGEKISRIK